MESNVMEIAPDIYRISTFHPDFGIQFNQFLIKDDEPFIMHTGMKKMFPVTREAIASLIEPARLRWRQRMPAPSANRKRRHRRHGQP